MEGFSKQFSINLQFEHRNYGVGPSAYQALRCLQQLAFLEESSYPDAQKLVKENMYVDDVLLGSHSIESAVTLAHKFQRFLMAGGFPLRKWAANHPSILKDIPMEWCIQDPNKLHSLTKEHHLLGLNWNCGNDSFSFSVQFQLISKPVTKRVVLSIISQLYDPLGLASPVSVLVKMFFQSLWSYRSSEEPDSRSLDWDEPLPNPLINE